MAMVVTFRVHSVHQVYVSVLVSDTGVHIMDSVRDLLSFTASTSFICVLVLYRHHHHELSSILQIEYTILVTSGRCASCVTGFVI
jgi:hypothetical protein